MWHGELDEKESIMLRNIISSALRRCWDQIVTLGATISLAYLDLAAYFVGAEWQGSPSGNYQGFYQLCLQFTAKVLVNLSFRYL